jgi:hypothetical protein
MKITKWMKAEKDECLVLNKIIYGLVQSARDFMKSLFLHYKNVDLKCVLLIPVSGLITMILM